MLPNFNNKQTVKHNTEDQQFFFTVIVFVALVINSWFRIWCIVSIHNSIKQPFLQFYRSGQLSLGLRCKPSSISNAFCVLQKNRTQPHQTEFSVFCTGNRAKHIQDPRTDSRNTINSKVQTSDLSWCHILEYIFFQPHLSNYTFPKNILHETHFRILQKFCIPWLLFNNKQKSLHITSNNVPGINDQLSYFCVNIC